MIQSMTAYASVSGQGEWGSAVWECRSVNHRFLDINFKVSEQFRGEEPKWRQRIKPLIHRGKVEFHLRFRPSPEIGSEVEINYQLVNKLIKGHQEIASHLHGMTGENSDRVRIMDIMRWPDVLLVSEPNIEQASGPLLKMLDQLLVDLISHRQREGKETLAFLLGRIQGLEEELVTLDPLLEEIMVLQREKLKTRFDEANITLDPERLEQELLLFAQKMDVAEELDRLKTHCKEMRRVLGVGGPVGRRLDFLLQEMNREANTLASKVIHPTVTQSAVKMKVCIEQMREQVQNIE